MEEFMNWFVCVSTFIGIAGIFLIRIHADTNEVEQARRMGRRDRRIRTSDCRESVVLLVSFISGKIHRSARKWNECQEAGCDGSSILMDSKDISVLVKAAHSVGGQLVVRKVADHDIECDKNTVLEVKKKLTDLDIERAKRIRRKERRKRYG